MLVMGYKYWMLALVDEGGKAFGYHSIVYTRTYIGYAFKLLIRQLSFSHARRRYALPLANKHTQRHL